MCSYNKTLAKPSAETEMVFPSYLKWRQGGQASVPHMDESLVGGCL